MLIRKLSRISKIRGATQLSGMHRPSADVAMISFSKKKARTLSTSPWAEFKMAPVDPIVGLNEIYQKDEYPSKVIVGVGAYRDDVGLILTSFALFIFQF